MLCRTFVVPLNLIKIESMIKKYTFALLLIAFLSSFDAVAQTQAEMNRTAQNDFKKADAQLNTLYQKVMKILSGKEKHLMIQAQKDWIKFRDSHCKFEIEQYEGGSIQPLMYATCLTEKTKQRIADLKAILEEQNR